MTKQLANFTGFMKHFDIMSFHKIMIYRLSSPLLTQQFRLTTSRTDKILYAKNMLMQAQTQSILVYNYMDLYPLE